MSKLVTITSKFYDKSGRYVRNLKVKSRYQNSSRENLKKTDTDGLFVFQASPNRMVEILAKPPKASDYTVVKVINSSTLSSSEHPIKIQLPNTIEEYRQMNSTISQNGLVVTPFQVVDVHGKIMANFPIQTRPKGKKSFERITDDQGRVEVLSSANRDIEFLALTSNDEFVLKRSLNSGNGTEKPILIQLDEPYEKFKGTSTLTLVDREGSNYVIEKTNIEMLIVATGKKKVYSISNGKLPLISMVGQRLQFTVLKPDGKPLDPVSYVAKRVKEEAIKLHLDVDIVKGLTEKNEPIIEQNIKLHDCACGRDITLDDLKALAVGSTKHLSKFIAPINDSFKIYKIDKCIQKAYFISQTFLETSEYKYLEERVSAEYEKNNYGGYKGRGLIQLTWKDNYIAYGKFKGEDFTGVNRVKISSPKYAVDSAAWFWRKGKARDLNELALKNDLIGVSAIINGGFNHFDNDNHGGRENRKAYLLRAFKILKVGNCKIIDQSLLSSLDDFKLENSIVNDMVGEVFGWGLWHDPEYKKIGCTKSLSEARKGYARFIELSKNQKFKPPKRYGYTQERAEVLARRKLSG